MSILWSDADRGERLTAALLGRLARNARATMVQRSTGRRGTFSGEERTTYPPQFGFTGGGFSHGRDTACEIEFLPDVVFRMKVAP